GFLDLKDNRGVSDGDLRVGLRADRRRLEDRIALLEDGADRTDVQTVLGGTVAVPVDRGAVTSPVPARAVRRNVETRRQALSDELSIGVSEVVLPVRVEQIHAALERDPNREDCSRVTEALVSPLASAPR